MWASRNSRILGILEFLRFFKLEFLRFFLNLEFLEFLRILEFARNSRILAYSIRTKGIK